MDGGMRTINDYDDLMLFMQLQREAHEQGASSFVFNGQYYSVVIAEAIINEHLNKGGSNGGTE